MEMSYFPSFSEGLSLREYSGLFDRTCHGEFPFLFGGTFIEGYFLARTAGGEPYFPSFSEGLSLRVLLWWRALLRSMISLPFRRDFH